MESGARCSGLEVDALIHFLPPESISKSTSEIPIVVEFTPFFCMKRRAGRMNE
jgi:hypothetical protein